MTVRALHDHIIVRRESAHNLFEIVGHKEHRGVVVAVGPGKFRSDPQTGREWFCPMTLKVGDRILFSHRAGMDTQIEGENLLVMHEADVLCVLEDDATVGMGEDWRTEQSTSVAAYDARHGKTVKVG